MKKALYGIVKGIGFIKDVIGFILGVATRLLIIVSPFVGLAFAYYKNFDITDFNIHNIPLLFKYHASTTLLFIAFCVILAVIIHIVVKKVVKGVLFNLFDTDSASYELQKSMDKSRAKKYDKAISSLPIEERFRSEMDEYRKKPYFATFEEQRG